MPPSRDSDDILLQADSVRAALRTLEGLANELSQHTQRVTAVLSEADRGDWHGYLQGGLSEGYEAAHLGRVIEAELRDVIRNASATVVALEQHDLNVVMDATATSVVLPVLVCTPADVGPVDVAPVSTPQSNVQAKSETLAANETALKQVDARLDSAIKAIPQTKDISRVMDRTLVANEDINRYPGFDHAKSLDPISNDAVRLDGQPQEPQQVTLTSSSISQAPPQLEEQKNWWASFTGWFKDRWNNLQAWQRGVLKGIAIFALGLAAIAFIALVITGGLAVLGAVTFALPAFLTVLAVLGIVLLIGFFIKGVFDRYHQVQDIHKNQPWYQDLLIAIPVSALDVFGITSIIEGINGKEIISGRPLSEEQRAEQATIGALTILSILIIRAGKGKGSVLETLEKPPLPRNLSKAAADTFKGATPERQSVFRRNVNFLESFSRLSAEDQAFLRGVSDPVFDAYSKLPLDLQVRFLQVSEHVYSPSGRQSISFRTNYNQLSPEQQLALLSEGEIRAMERLLAMDQRYTNAQGLVKEGHSFAEHGAYRSDAEMFARAREKGFPVSRYNSFVEQEQQVLRFRQILEDPNTPTDADGSPINSNGQRAINNGQTTVEQILRDPLNNIQYLKARVQYKKQPVGPNRIIGTEFDSDGVTMRTVDHVTVVFELDDTGHYQLLTTYPENP